MFDSSYTDKRFTWQKALFEKRSGSLLYFVNLKAFPSRSSLPILHLYQEKYEYVEKVIDLLEMRDFADAVIGVPGEGLNVLQRKKLTVYPMVYFLIPDRC